MKKKLSIILTLVLSLSVLLSFAITASGAAGGYLLGDFNEDGSVSTKDALHLLYHISFPDKYPVNQSCDVNGDGSVDTNDAVHLLYHAFFPNDYALVDTNSGEEVDPYYVEGDGTADNPYLIGRASHLDYVVAAMTGDGEIVAPDGRVVTVTPAVLGMGSHIKLIADINWGEYKTNATHNWEPIGNKQNVYHGTFDGQGHFISGLRVYEESIDSQGEGLFAAAGISAVIKNTVIKNSTFASGDYVSAFVGQIAMGGEVTIENCASYAELALVSSTSKGARMGSMIGGTVGDTAAVVVKNCVNYGDLYSYKTVSSATYAGGIVGRAGTKLPVTIESCANFGNINASAFDIIVGGIVGQVGTYNGIFDIYIKNCYNAGDVSARRMASGIAGRMYNYVTMEDCYNIGAVTIGGDDSDVNRALKYATEVGNFNGDIEWLSTVTNSYHLAGLATSTSALYPMVADGGVALPEGIYDVPKEYQGIVADEAFMTGQSAVENMGFSLDVWQSTEGYPILKGITIVSQYDDGFEEQEPEIPHEPIIIFKGSGTEDDPYLIENRDDLAALAEYYMNEEYVGKYYKMTADIKWSDYNGDPNEPPASSNWKPIGTADNPFIGTFDGNGFSVSGLYATGDQSGFFKNVTGTVKNLTIKDSYFHGEDYAAGIVVLPGEAGTLTVLNCANYATITGADKAGGIVAGANDATRTYVIDRCVNFGSVTSTGSNCAGILGYIAYAKSVTVKMCANYGDITGKNLMGGIVGYLGATATNNSGVDVGTYVVSDCLNAGNVTNTNKNANGVGGIVGRLRCGTIKDCINTGLVTTVGEGKQINSGTIFGDLHSAGNIAGDTKPNDHAIINCYSLENCFTNTNGNASPSADDFPVLTAEELVAGFETIPDPEGSTKNAFGFDSMVWTHDGNDGYPTIKAITVVKLYGENDDGATETIPDDWIVELPIYDKNNNLFVVHTCARAVKYVRYPAKYSDDGSISSVTVREYDSAEEDGKIIQQTTYEETGYINNRTLYSYDEDGNLLGRTRYSYTEEFIDSATVYDANDNKIQYIRYMKNGGRIIQDLVDGLCKKVTSYSAAGTVYLTYSCSVDNSYLSFSWYTNSGKIATVSEYDASKNHVKEIRYDENCKVEWSSTHKYDESGNATEVSLYDKNDILLFSYVCTSGCREAYASVSYSSDGVVSGMGVREYSSKSIFDRKTIRYTRFYANGVVERIEEYDDKENCTKRFLYNSDGSMSSGMTYEYYDNGKWKEVNRYNSDGSLLSRTTWEYYDNGNYKEVIDYYSDGSIQSHVLYDENGKKVKSSYKNDFGFSFIMEYDDGYAKKVTIYDIEGIERLTYVCSAENVYINYLCYSSDGQLVDIEEYDANGNRVKVFAYDENFQLENIFDLSYDANGKHIQSIRYDAYGNIEAIYRFD